MNSYQIKYIIYHNQHFDKKTMPQNKSDKKASLIASIFLWHQSLIDLVTLGRTIDFCFPSFPHETEGDGLIFFFNIPCEPSTRPYLAGIICRITVSLFSNMTYILAETKPCPRSTLGGFQGNWCYSFSLLIVPVCEVS